MDDNLEPKSKNVTICSHPLVQVLVSEIRSTETDSLKFRRLLKELSRHVVYEALRDIPLKSIVINTPLEKTEGHDFLHNKFILAPILRAGLSMIDGAIETLPMAEIRHIGLYRNEETLKPVEYYVKLPDVIDNQTTVLILDPMLATGGSAISAIEVFKRRKVEKIKFLCLIASQPGVQALNEVHPDVQIYAAALDPKLNDNGYIVPGLGDAGDRCFGTT